MKSIKKYICEGQVDNDAVRELLLVAWNTRKIYDLIEYTMKSMRKKDPSTIDKDILANSSTMSKICTACIREEDPNWKVNRETRKEFYRQLADEIVDRLYE